MEIHQPPGQPLITSGLQADARIVSYLKGLNHLDDRLENLVRPMGDIFGGCLPPSHELSVTKAAASWDRPQAGRLPIVELVGPDPVVLRGVAAQAAARLGLQLYALSSERLRSWPGEAADLLRLWERETLLLPVAMYVDAMNLGSEEATGLATTLADLGGAVFVGCREPWPVPGRSLRLVNARRPTAAEQEDLWAAALGPEAAAGAGRLAAQFDLNQVAIRDASRGGGSGAQLMQVWETCRDQARPRLDMLAQRVEPVATWDDLVLPPEGLGLLHHLVDQVRGRPTVLRHWGFAERITRGTGIAALFAGPPAPERRSPPRSSPTNSALPCTGSICPESSASTSARRSAISGVCSTPPTRGARCSSSTRPTHCSASAARSGTATTATPTSR